MKIKAFFQILLLFLILDLPLILEAANKKTYVRRLVKPAKGKSIPNSTIDALNIDYREHQVEIKDLKFFKLEWPEADYSKEVPLKVLKKASVGVRDWHFYAGVPFAKGMLDHKDKVALFSGKRKIKIQTEILSYWGPKKSDDGKSIKWLALNFVDRVSKNKSEDYVLKILKKEQKNSIIKVKVKESSRVIKVNNGILDLQISKRKFNLFEKVKVKGKVVLEGSDETGAYISDRQGQLFYAAKDSKPIVEIEEKGPLHVSIRAEGWFVNPNVKIDKVEGEPFERPKGGFCRYVTRLSIMAGQPYVKVQHTFILTEDSDQTQYGKIGLELPLSKMKNDKIYFGSCSKPKKGHHYLLQKSFRKFEVNQVGKNGDVKKVDSGKKAKGWVQAGGVAVSMKDFWQSYPNELEVDPEKKRMYIHFWPDHGVKRQDTLDDLNHENGFRMPFVHSGKYLDFKFPDEVYGSGEVFRKKILYLEGAKRSNALGVAKTQDLLISFEDKEFEKRQEIFTSSLPIYCDPKYLEYTKAIPFLTAADPEAYPIIEKWMYGGINFLKKIMEKYNAYGKWVNGSTCDFFQWEGNKIFPNNRRLYSGTHHNKPRIIWWLFLRNGDPSLLELARQNTRYCMDIFLCHWTNKKFEKKKKIGGMCDYKGIVPWHAGNRASYNSMVEHLLYDYYLNGNRRAFEAATDHAFRVKESAGDKGREGAGRINTLTNYYRATWNRKIKLALHSLVKKYLENSPIESHAVWWTPWALNYWDLTQKESIKKYITKWADEEIHIMIDDVIAGAYYITDDKKYAKQVARNVMRWSSVLKNREDDLDGMFSYRWGVTWSFPVMKTIIGMRAIKNADMSIEDITPHVWFRESYGITTPHYIRHKADAKASFGKYYPWPDRDIRRVEAMIYNDGSSKSFRLGNRSQKKSVKIEVLDPSGHKILQLQHSGKKNVGYKVMRKEPRVTTLMKVVDGKTVVEELYYDGMPSIWKAATETFSFRKDDPIGHYKIIYESEGEFASFQLAPIMEPDQMTWFKVGKESTLDLSGAKFFWVPKKVREFELHFLPSFSPAATTRRKMYYAAGTIYDPDLKASACFSTGIEKRPVVVKIKPKQHQKGKAWFFVAEHTSVVKMVGIPPYISPSYASFKTKEFIPKMKDVK